MIASLRGYCLSNRLAPLDPSHDRSWAPPSYSAEGGMGLKDNIRLRYTIIV